MLAYWWKNGVQLKLRMRIYPDGLLIAVLYALACWAARELSVTQFYLVAGIRVAALLLCPPRLWPYLFLGEYAYLAQLRYPLIDTYGVAWVIIGSVIVMPAVALTVRLHERMRRRASGAWLLSMAAVAAIAAALLNIAAAELFWAVPTGIPMSTRAMHQSLGNFIGILTVAPPALLWLQRRELMSKPLLPIPTIALFSLILVLGLSATRIPPEYAGLEMSVQLLMTLPAIALTCLHGWRGAALSVPLLYLIIGLTMPSTGRAWSFDSDTFAVQQIMAVAGAALLALGSTISHHYHRYTAHAFNRAQTASLTKGSHLAGELDLRNRAQEINRIGDGIDAYLSETADWLRRQGHDEIATRLIQTSSLYSRKFREQASMVYPTALEHVGLYLALQVGGISEAWSSTGCIGQPRLTGDPCRLPVPLQLATYRTLTEAVSLLLEHEGRHMRVSARCGRVGNREGILVVVAMLDSRHRLCETTRALAIERLSGRALTYGGTVQCRHNRIRMLFVHGPDTQGQMPHASLEPASIPVSG